MPSVNNFYARVADEDPTRIDVGVFADDECRTVISIIIERAIALRDALSKAIEDAMRNVRRAAIDGDPAPLYLLIPYEAWRDDTEEQDRSHLLGTIIINNCRFFMDAVAVEEGEHHILQAVNPKYMHEFERIDSLGFAEGPLRTLTIGDRDYAVAFTPSSG